LAAGSGNVRFAMSPGMVMMGIFPRAAETVVHICSARADSRKSDPAIEVGSGWLSILLPRQTIAQGACADWVGV